MSARSPIIMRVGMLRWFPENSDDLFWKRWWAGFWCWAVARDWRPFLSVLLLVYTGRALYDIGWLIVMMHRYMPVDPEPVYAWLLIADIATLVSAGLFALTVISSGLLTLATQRSDPGWRSPRTSLAVAVHLLFLGLTLVNLVGLRSMELDYMDYGLWLTFRRLTFACILLVVQLVVVRCLSHVPVMRRVAAYLPLAHQAVLVWTLPMFLDKCFHSYTGCIK